MASNKNYFLYFCVLVVSLSVLSFEIALTRIFALIEYYHFVFIIVSSAILGLGLAGFVIYSRKKTEPYYRHIRTLVKYLLLYSVSLPLCVSVLLILPFKGSLLVYILISVIPFYFAGLFIVTVYDIHASSCNKVYFSDLMGASLGCLSIVLLINLVGAINTVILLGLLISVVALILSFYQDSVLQRSVVFVIIIINLILFFTNRIYKYDNFILLNKDIDKPLFKALKKGNNRIIDSKWNIYARTDLMENIAYPDIKQIYTDGINPTLMVKFKKEKEKQNLLKKFLGYFPYYLGQPDDVFIIGSGGGFDVLLSLIGNSENITAVEINPAIVDIVRKYSSFTGGIYNNHNQIKVKIDEGRSTLRRSSEKYDIIYLSLAFTGTPQGISYAFVENYLYTKEAFRDYLAHLKENGKLVIIEQSYERTMKCLSTGLSVLTEKDTGIKETFRQFAIIRNSKNSMGSNMYRNLFILKKNPFTKNESRKISNLCTAFNFTPVVLPWFQKDIFLKLENGEMELNQFISESPYNIKPVTDNSPFFYNFTKGIKGNIKILLFPFIVFLILFLSLSAILFRKEKTDKNIKITDFVFCVSGLGISYMLIEISLMQKFILFLGYPTLSFSVILFSLLFSSSIGSYTSNYIIDNNLTKKISTSSLAIPILLIIYIITIQTILNKLLPLSITLRSAITVFLLFPVGFLMGIPFPNILKLLDRYYPEEIPLIWGLNGISSVLGSILAVIIALYTGFNTVLLLASLIYLGIFLRFNRLKYN